MYKLMKLEDEFWYICDSATMTPPLLALRYLEAELIHKAYNTQRAELQSLLLFYEYWLAKHGETLDFSLWKSGFQDIEQVLNEMQPFWDYLVAGRTLNVVVLPTAQNKKENLLATASVRTSALIRFVRFLMHTYLDSRYSPIPKNELLAKIKMLEINIKPIQTGLNKHIKQSQSGNVNRFHSLTKNQCSDFLDVVRLSTSKNPNPLNPHKNQKKQLRNYLMWMLMLRYGLRAGEVLLLKPESFKPYMTSNDKMLMIVDSLDEEGDLRTLKPKIKTSSSARYIDISKQHYDMIMGIYYKIFRPAQEQCGHDYIFTSSIHPFKPLSYASLSADFNIAFFAFAQHFPEHFDSKYAESLNGKSGRVTAHWLRHTWAYTTLAHLYRTKLESYRESDFVKVTGVMEDAINSLRKLGGWSETSRMPNYYASRFISENANQELLNIFENEQINEGLNVTEI